MFSGAQFSLYPMTDEFVPAILRGVAALDAYKDALRRDTDDLSTLLVGPSDTVVRALRDSFIATASGGGHVVMSATLSRGCPGESDDPICAAPALIIPADDADLVTAAVGRFDPGAPSGLDARAQISLYPLGGEGHMARIGACIDFLKAVGVYDKPKHFCSKLRGDASVLFAAIERSFIDFAPAQAHVVLSLTVSVGSPSLR
ncbi:MAG: HMP/thiamine-binding protein [Rhizobiales bacterium 65-9]|nr:HMP/thiamine-binding protein [Hyphomicrobiales bacterium]OJY37248.1 MAG: HMP/thiamine-binding protein [Rhizobiales bacterium 65-9]